MFGSKQLAKLERGRFDLLYDEFLPAREADGDHPLLQFNHPRTFRQQTASLDGNWDQIFDINLQDIPKASERAKKFNDFGLDDYAPLSGVLPQWIAGDAMPDRATVDATLTNIEGAARPYLRLFEVLVGRGTSIAGTDHENASLIVDSTTHEIRRYTRVHSDWDYYLLHGFRTAPTAPHDNHFANWGTGHSTRTAIIADELTEDALLEAIDQRLVYASEDEELTMRVYADHRVPMGSTLVTHAGSATLDVYLADADYTGAFEVVVYGGTLGGDAVGEVVHVTLAGNAWQQVTIPLPADGDHFFYLEVAEPSPDRMAWSAPIWITKL